MIDIDHFKVVNDTHGHQTGDAALAAVAAGIRDSLRGYDITGRFGGEEFGVLFPGTGLDQACQIADRLRRTLATVTILAKNARVPITVSVGVAALDPAAPAGLDDLIATADTALYRAKNTGRN